MKKLNLNKETIAALDDRSMSEIKGGFTYSLSTGKRCRISVRIGGHTPSHCAELMEVTNGPWNNHDANASQEQVLQESVQLEKLQ